jgi:diguanylate cyclase (GGDEF)-like protein/PAS domain S-box-containing protein
MTFIVRLLLLLVALVSALSVHFVYAAEPVKIGVLALRSKEQTLKQWQPLTEAMNKALPAYHFDIDALTYPELDLAVASRQLDFVLTNPSHYVKLHYGLGLGAPLATLAMNEQGQMETVFGGVIFTLARQTGLNDLSDVKGKTVAVVHQNSLGEYQAQAYEFHQAGINLSQDVKLLETGMPHDNVVNEVLNSRAEVGFVRTGVLEAMAKQGKLDLAKVKILNLQNLHGFPAQSSTKLYPEWAFASMPNVDASLAKHMAATLFKMEEDTLVTNALGIHGFVVPADYTPVANVLKTLRVDPFDTSPEFTLRDALKRYRWQLLLTVLAFATLMLQSLHLFWTKRKLHLNYRLSLKQQEQIQESELRLKLAIEGSRISTWDWNIQTDVAQYSKLSKEMLGYSDNDTLSTHDEWFSRVHPGDQLYVKNMTQAYLEGVTDIYVLRCRLRCKDDSYKWILDRGMIVSRSEEGKPLRMIGTHTDITEQKTVENDLRIAAAAFESQTGMAVTDAKNIILRVNNAFTRITGYTPEEAIGQTPRLLTSGRHDKAFYTAMWESINNTGSWEGEIWNRRKSGDIYPEHLTITAVKNANGIVTNYVASLTDITISKAASEEIKNLAFYDPLTRLPNRRLFTDRLQQALAASTRSKQRGALLLLDLDHFKTLNDTLGHDIGDLLLQQVAHRLSISVREGDTVARIGGDEFVVLLEDLSGQDIEAAKQTEAIGENILATLCEPYHLGTYEHLSTPSIGVTIFNNHDESSDTLLKQAEIAMYQSKAVGRSTLLFYDPKMQELITSRADMEHEIRQAIAKQQFQLYYQVQMSSEDQPLGAEALIRWHHPELGMIPPFQFIPLAEETGLILPIGQWVLDTACAQLKIWEQNKLTQHLTLSVNVSAKQFHQSNFVTQVQSTIMRHDINPTRLNLELTESMLLDNVEGMIESMNELRAIGVKFELDDFGTGYSSLQYLKKLPLYQLKIDQSFIRDIAIDSSDRTLVCTIITMAHSLDLEVIAEGVEDNDQRLFLKNNGCNHYQGYLFGKPVPIDEFEAALRKS